MTRAKRSGLTAALILCLLPAALAQKPVYRCTDQGRVSYSDAPCLGAIAIDATPTQGMDMSSGKSLKGKEVRAKEFSEALRGGIGEGTRALHGMSRDEFIKTTDMKGRERMSLREQTQCSLLERQIPEAELAVLSTATNSAERGSADVTLYKLRKQYFDLKC